MMETSVALVDHLKGRRCLKCFDFHHQSTSRFFAIINVSSDDGACRHQPQRSRRRSIQWRKFTLLRRGWLHVPSSVTILGVFHHFANSTTWCFAHSSTVIWTKSMKPHNNYRQEHWQCFSIMCLGCVLQKPECAMVLRKTFCCYNGIDGIDSTLL